MPVALPILVPFLALLAAVTALALHQTENQWLRPLLESLAHPKGSFLKRVAIRAAHFVVGGVLYIEKHVRGALSHFAGASLHLITRWLHGMTHLWQGMADEIAHIADEVADALGFLVHHRIPAMIRAAVKPVDRVAHAALHDARRSISLVRRAERDFTRGIDRLRHGLEAWVLTRLHGIDRLIRQGVIPRLRAAERAIGHAVTVDIPALWRRERALENEVRGDIRARIRRLERALGLGVFAAIALRTLARVAPWIFCRNWKRAAPRVCAMPTDALDDLLLAVTVTVGALSIVELARELQGVVGIATDGVHSLLTDD